MDLALAGFGLLLILSWALMMINSAIESRQGNPGGILFVALFATLGYLVSLQWVLRRSPTATYLWVRYVQRRPVERRAISRTR